MAIIFHFLSDCRSIIIDHLWPSKKSGGDAAGRGAGKEKKARGGEVK